MADPGGTWEIGFNESDSLHTEWAAIVSAYETAKASGKRVWFEAYHPSLSEAFYIVGEPNKLGFGGAEVSSAYANTGRVTINKVEGWSASVNPTSGE